MGTRPGACPQARGPAPLPSSAPRTLRHSRDTSQRASGKAVDGGGDPPSTSSARRGPRATRRSGASASDRPEKITTSIVQNPEAMHTHRQKKRRKANRKSRSARVPTMLYVRLKLQFRPINQGLELSDFVTGTYILT